jgi:hypothetical protein
MARTVIQIAADPSYLFAAGAGGVTAHGQKSKPFFSVGRPEGSRIRSRRRREAL